MIEFAPKKKFSSLGRLREKGLTPNIQTFEAVCRIRGNALAIAAELEAIQGGDWRIEVEQEAGFVMIRCY